MGSAASNFTNSFQIKLMEKKITQSTLYLLSIDEELTRLGFRDIKKNMKYKEIFNFFVKNNMVPIGLHRNNKDIVLDINKKNKPYVYLCPKRDDIIEIERDKIYVLASEKYFTKQRTQQNDKSNAYIQISKTSKLIDKSNDLILNLAQDIKKLVENGAQKMRQNFSVKKVINEVRESMRSELSNIYDELVNDNKENKIGEIKEDESEESESKSQSESESKSENKEETKSKIKSGKKSSSLDSDSSEGANSSPSKSYMEALKRTRNYMNSHRQQKDGDNKKNTNDEKSD